jgi:acetylglutamate synthase
MVSQFPKSISMTISSPPYLTSLFPRSQVGGAVVAEELEELGDALAFLQKVGLFPIVVHGGGPQLNKRLEALGEEPQYVKGLRVT